MLAYWLDPENRNSKCTDNWDNCLNRHKEVVPEKW